MWLDQASKLGSGSHPMDHQQAVPAPCGVSVFGSSMIRVAPDVAVLNIAAVSLQKQPEAAFAEARGSAESVRVFLQRAGVPDVASSRITLKQEFRYTGGEQRFEGYLARVGFQILLRDLDRIEEILLGAVKAGATEIVHVDLQTTQLRELRIEARKRAVAAAREKAQAYCEAANVSLGRVLHIEDVNPDILTGVRDGHVHRQVSAEDTGTLRAFDPGAIPIGAAVQVVYAVVTTQPGTG